MRAVLAAFAGLAAAGILSSAAQSSADHAGARALEQARPYVVRGVTTKEQRTALVQSGFDVAAVRSKSVVVVATPAEREALERRGLRATPARVPARFVQPPAASPEGFPAADSGYHDYAEMLAEVRAVAAAHPENVRLFSLGVSYEGRDLIAARVSNDAFDRTDEPGVLFVGQHHAREHLSVEVVLSLLHLFAESTDPTVRSLVQTRQIYIVPSLNPDGGEYDVATGSYRFWRKNRQRTPGSFYVGTDANRNYAYLWGCCGGSSSSPSSETYRGWQPFSAPEVARLRDFVDAHANVRTSISYHSYGDMVLYPYGYTYDDLPPDMTPADRDAFVAIAGEIGRTTGYTPKQSSDLYITDGDFNDWMYGAKRTYPFTIELGGYGYGFYPPDEYIPLESQKNHAAAVYVAQVAECPTQVVGVACSAPPPPPPPPPGASEAVLPSATVVQTGSRRAGTADDLRADDASYFEVSSAYSWTPTTSWYGRFDGVSNELTGLKVSYKGKNSRSCTQTVAIWRWTTSSWVQLDSRAVGSEASIAGLAPSGTPADYVSGTSGPGEARVRVRCAASGSPFHASGNLLRLDVTRAG